MALIITVIILIILAAISIAALTNGNFIGLATRASQNYAEAQEYESKIMEDYVRRLEEVRRNIKIGGYFEEAGTLDGGAKGSYNPTIPEGFKPVDTEDSKWGDGTTAPAKEDVDKGLVIEDKDGNQFVWVPCSTTGTDIATETKVTTYAKHEYTGDANDEGTNQSETDGWKTNSYRAYEDWTDPAVDNTGEEGYGTKSVKEYGGFYVARYEAGIPETADFYNEAVKTAYKPQYKEGKFDPESEKDIRNIGTIAPVSKKNTSSWSWISQTNAIKASEKMLEGKSHLIDGTAWDTIVEWIGAKEKTIEDSSSVGNYHSSTGNIPTDTMYIKHKYDSRWTTGDRYERANEDITQPGGNGTDRYEVYTGSLENTKLKNIYDMAGNMWEWTTETGKHNTESGSSFAVIRGGGFADSAITSSLCKRHGGDSPTYTEVAIGFRVVLYL